MKVARFTFNPFYENCYVLWQAEGGDAYVVDPGMMNDQEQNALVAFLDEKKLSVSAILLTHMHIDHVAGARWLAQKYSAEIMTHVAEEPLGLQLVHQAERFHLQVDTRPVTITRYLRQDDELLLADEPLRVLETPGHSPGSLSFHAPQSRFVLTGDAVFAMSIGRTDLPGGDFNQLISSIQTQILSLPEDVMILPGHADATTVGQERAHNPYVKMP